MQEIVDRLEMAFGDAFEGMDARPVARAEGGRRDERIDDPGRIRFAAEGDPCHVPPPCAPVEFHPPGLAEETRHDVVTPTFEMEDCVK